MSEHAKVLVVWLDAHAEGEGWNGLADVDVEPCRVKTIGWLIPDAKPGHVAIAQSVAMDGDCYHLFCVPVGMVESLTIL